MLIKIINYGFQHSRIIIYYVMVDLDHRLLCTDVDYVLFAIIILNINIHAHYSADKAYK